MVSGRRTFLVRGPLTPTSQARVLARLAIIAGIAGILSTVPMWPPAQMVLLTTLLLTGAGSALLCWVNLSGSGTVAGIIGVSVATVIALACSLLWSKLWYPVPSCVLLSLGVLVIGSARLWTLRDEVEH